MMGEEMGQGIAATKAEEVGSRRDGRKHWPVRKLDDQLVKEAMCGDNDAIDKVITAYYRDILYFATKKVGSQAGEDVAQHAIGNIIDSLERLDDPSKLKSWMMSITNHCCADYMRKTSLNKKLFTVVNEFDEDTGDVEERYQEFLPEQALINSETRDQVITTIDSLPQNYADALRLYYLDGLSYSEIGEVLDVDYRKVQNDLHNGRNLFRKRYEHATGTQLRYSSLGAGAVPILTQVLTIDRDQSISPEVAERTLDFIHKHISGREVAGATATQSIGGQAAIHALPVAKVVVGALAVLGVGAAVTFGVMQDVQQEQVQGVAQEESSPHEVTPIQEERPIETVADMIGEDEAARLDAFEAGSVDISSWQEFIERIGAETSRTGADVDYVYTMYVLQKQDKQLILADRVSNSDGSITVVSLFEQRGELPRITKVILMFP